MRAILTIGALLFLFAVPGAALAEDDGLTGAAWDHRHMRARHPGQRAPKSRAPVQTGLNGYDHVESGQAPEVVSEIPETLEAATQRSWQGGRAPVTFGRNHHHRDKGVSVQDLPSSRRSGTGGSTLRGGVHSTPTR